MSHFIFLMFKNETQTCYSGMLSFPFSYLKKVKHNVCFKKCSQVDIDGPWISSGLFYFLLAVLSDCIIRQILELYKHMRFAYILLSQISSANGQPNSLMYLKLSGAFHVSLIYLFTATI